MIRVDARRRRRLPPVVVDRTSPTATPSAHRSGSPAPPRRPGVFQYSANHVDGGADRRAPTSASRWRPRRSRSTAITTVCVPAPSGDVDGVRGRALVDPAVDDQAPVHIQPDAVIGGHGERVRAGRQVQRPRPPGHEMIGVDARAPATPATSRGRSRLLRPRHHRRTGRDRRRRPGARACSSTRPTTSRRLVRRRVPGQLGHRVQAGVEVLHPYRVVAGAEVDGGVVGGGRLIVPLVDDERSSTYRRTPSSVTVGERVATGREELGLGPADGEVVGRNRRAGSVRYQTKLMVGSLPGEHRRAGQVAVGEVLDRRTAPTRRRSRYTWCRRPPR